MRMPSRRRLAKVADARSPVKELVAKSYYAPVVVKVRTVKPSEGEGPAVLAVDLWFTVHGDWKKLTSREFLESVLEPADEGKSRVVTKSGALGDQELAARKLAATVKKGHEERFVYSTFSLFERVEISATRFTVLTRGEDVVLAAGRVDPRFAKDREFPNQWRPLFATSGRRFNWGRPIPGPTAADTSRSPASWNLPTPC